MSSPLRSITVIFSPYNHGIPDSRFGDGPNRIRDQGIVKALETTGVEVHVRTIEPVDSTSYELQRTFEVMRRVSIAVTECHQAQSFPLIVSGNCMSTVSAACGLPDKDLGVIYIDAHDDIQTPSTNVNGLFDATSFGMLFGEAWHALAKTIPGFRIRSFDDTVFVGLRDVQDEEKHRLEELNVDVVWGSRERKVDFAQELTTVFDRRGGNGSDKARIGRACVHLDLDALDISVGKANEWSTAGGLHEDDLQKCMKVLATKIKPASMTISAFNPNLGDGDKVAKVAIEGMVTFTKSMITAGVVVSKSK